jgi:hypothetical protein
MKSSDTNVGYSFSDALLPIMGVSEEFIRSTQSVWDAVLTGGQHVIDTVRGPLRKSGHVLAMRFLLVGV